MRRIVVDDGTLILRELSIACPTRVRPLLLVLVVLAVAAAVAWAAMKRVGLVPRSG